MNDAEVDSHTLPSFLSLRVAESPAAIAFWQEADHTGWDPITWQEFELRVARLRDALHAAGLRKGERLALIAPVSLEWELVHHAALAMGAVVVGIDAHDLPARIALLAEQADVAGFVTSDARTLASVLPQRLARVRFVLDLGGGAEIPAGVRGFNWAEFNALAQSATSQPARPTADDLATIIFTSGTTGDPRGIAYSHRQVCLAIDAICDVFSFVDQRSRLLCWLPLSNLLQRMVNLAGMRKGAATYLLGDPRRVLTALPTAAPDIFIGVPRFYEKLYAGICERIATEPRLRRGLIRRAWSIGRRYSKHRLENRPVPVWLRGVHWIVDRTILVRVRRLMGARLRFLVTGSAPTPKHLLEEFHALGWVVLEAYGLSENVLPMAMNRPGDYRFGTVGRPLPGNEIVMGHDGTIKVRGPGVFTGYVGKGRDSSFDDEGFYATGDSGQWDDDGRVILTGRTGDMIKTSTGHRIAPAGVEASLRKVPGVDQAVLIGAGRKCAVALCSLQSTLDRAGRESLKAALNEQLEFINENERPRAIGVIERPLSIELGELTANLKLRRGTIEMTQDGLIRKLYETLDASEQATGAAIVFDGQCEDHTP